MTDYDKGYIAGLLVGEGSFTGSNNGKTFYPSIAVKMNDDDMEPMQKLLELLGGKLNGPYNHGGRHYCIWQIRGKNALALIPLLDEILPASRKRRQFLVWRAKVLQI